MTQFKGKIIRYADHVDTDVIIPAIHLIHGNDIEYLSKFAMEGLDCNFHKKIRNGSSIIIAGKNFGCGSSRQQAPEVLKAAGIDVIVAESIARIFYRNAINVGLPVFIAPNILQSIDDEDEIVVDVEDGYLFNDTKGSMIRLEPIPSFLLDILLDGGLVQHLKNKMIDDGREQSH